MTATIRSVPVTIIVAMCLSAAAPQKQQFAIRGLGGNITSPFIADNCRFVSLIVNASESATRDQPGPPVETAFIAVFITISNQCTNQEININATGQPIVSGNVQRGVQVAGQVEGTAFDFSTFTSTPINGNVDLTLTTTDHPEMTHSESTFGTRSHSSAFEVSDCLRLPALPGTLCLAVSIIWPWLSLPGRRCSTVSTRRITVSLQSSNSPAHGVLDVCDRWRAWTNGTS